MTGSIVTFDDAIPFMPIEKLIANIEPQQDLHGYDAPWPAGGGLNKLPKANLDDALLRGITVTIADDGGITLNGTPTGNATITIPFDSPLPAGSYTWLYFNSSASDSVSLSLRTSSKALLSGSFQRFSIENVVQPITIAEDAYYWRIQVNADTTLTNFTFKPMLCVGTVASATYQPYSNECPISGWTGLSGWVEDEYDPTEQPTFSVSWQSEAGTVYGGSVDVVTGVLTVTDAIVDLGTLDYTYQSAYERFYATISNMKSYTSPRTVKYVCSCFESIYDGRDISLVPYGAIYNGSGININIKIQGITDATTFKNYVTGQTLVYKLAQPQTYQLTPQQISTLLGNNTVFVDTGDVSVTYQSTSGSTTVRTSFKSPLKSYSYNALKLFGNTFIEHGKG